MLNTIAKLRQFILDKAPTCIHKPQGKLTADYVTPTYEVEAGLDNDAALSQRSTIGHYLQMYDWDAALFSQGAHFIGRPDLAYCVVRNFLNFQHENGYVPRTVTADRVWDGHDLCKPFLAQSLWHQIKNHHHKACSKQQLLELMPPLDKYLRYFRNTRQDKSSGLYRWRNVLESGIDNNYGLLFPQEASKDQNQNVDKFADHELLACDLSSYLVCEFAAFANLAHQAGLTHLHTEYLKLSQSLKVAIESHLWDDQLESYGNVMPDLQTRNPIKTWSNLAPVFLGFAADDRAKRVIERYVSNKNEFLAPAGLTSVSLSEPLCNQSQRGLYGRYIVSNWQGPVWTLISVLACRGLRHYQNDKLASTIANQMVTTLSADLTQNHTLHENYHALTGQPLWAPQFMSWNFLILELLELL